MKNKVISIAINASLISIVFNGTNDGYFDFNEQQRSKTGIALIRTFANGNV